MPHVTGVASAANQDGRLELLVILSGREGPGGVWHARQTTPNGDWTGWDPLGQPQSGVTSNAPAVARNADGRLEAVVITDDGTVWGRAQTTPGGSDWSEWRSLQRPGDQKATGTPVLAQNKDGRLEVFVVRYNDETVWHAAQQPEAGWSGWDSLGRPGGGVSVHQANALTVARTPDGRLELFALEAPTGSQAIWHRWQLREGGWSPWASLKTPESPGVQIQPGVPIVARSGSGSLHLFTVASDGAVWFRRQSPTAAGGWADWWAMGWTWFDEVGAGVDAAGRLVLVATSKEHRLWQKEQIHPDAGVFFGWREWSSFGSSSYDNPGRLAGPMLASNADGRLELFLQSPAGGLYQRSQIPPSEGSASVWSDAREWPPPSHVAPTARRDQGAPTAPGYQAQTAPGN